MEQHIPLVIVFFASFFFYVGVKILASQKPLFISSRVFFVFVAIILLFQTITSLEQIFTRSEPFELAFWLGPIIFLSVITFLWGQLNGYLIIGVTKTSFNQALAYSLHLNRFEFQEHGSFIKLKGLDAQLQVAVQGWVGAGQIKLKNSEQTALLDVVMTGVNDFYRLNSVHPNKITALYYFTLGIMMLSIAGIMQFWW